MDAIDVHWGGQPAAWDALHVVGVAGQADRPAARAAIRAALRDALATWSGLPPARITLHGKPGHPPYAVLEADPGPRRVHLAISHDGDLSIAALRPAGAVGIDLMRITGIPDCADVARGYLGPAVASQLAALPAHARPRAFARAWSAHEARLKSLGLALTEWQADLAQRVAACRVFPLTLPDGYAGHLALLPPDGQSDPLRRRPRHRRADRPQPAA